MSAGPAAPLRFRITTFRAPVLRPGGDPTASDDHTWPKYGLALALELHELEDALGQPRPFLGKYQGEFYVGGQLREDRRLAANVLGMDVVSLDVDHGLTAPEVHERLRPWQHVIWHTYRHRPEAPRCRAAIPLARTITGEEYRRVWAWGASVLGGYADAKAADPSRACMFPPLRPDGSRAVVRVFNGAPLLIPDEVMPAPPAPRTPSPPLTRGRVSPDRADWEARQRLRTNENARQTAANLLDARVAGDRAERIVCPRCDRRSVWFWITPGKMTGARCDHLGSCGWFGGLDTLLDSRGALHVG